MCVIRGNVECGLGIEQVGTLEIIVNLELCCKSQAAHTQVFYDVFITRTHIHYYTVCLSVYVCLCPIKIATDSAALLFAFFL